MNPDFEHTKALTTIRINERREECAQWRLATKVMYDQQPVSNGQSTILGTLRTNVNKWLHNLSLTVEAPLIRHS